MERQNRLGSQCPDELRETISDGPDRLRPRNAFEPSRPLRADALHRMKDTLGRIHTAIEPADLRTNVAVGVFRAIRSIDLDESPSFHRDIERATVGTIKRAYRRECLHGETIRSEERRVGKEWRSRWRPDQYKKKMKSR